MMKYFSLSIFALVLIGMLGSCEEVLPDRVVISTIDSTYMQGTVPEAQERVVLFEEYTGASCSNCPDGHKIVKEMLNQYGSRFAAIGLHQSVLANPVKEGDEDLKTTESANLAAQFDVSSLPAAVINRKKFSGSWSQGRFNWKSAVQSDIGSPVKVNMSSSVSVDPNNQKDILELKIEILEDISDELNFSIMLGENHIKATQVDGLSKIDNYDHEHVLRKMYTGFQGNLLANPDADESTYKAGRVFLKKIELDGLKSHWKKEDLYVICFVTNNVTREVMQATEAKFSN